MMTLWNIFGVGTAEPLWNLLNISLNISYDTGYKCNIGGHVLNKNGKQNLQVFVLFCVLSLLLNEMQHCSLSGKLFHGTSHM